MVSRRRIAIMRKQIHDSISRARQRVTVREASQTYAVEFVSMKELVAEMGQAAATREWTNNCFALDVKNVPDMSEPVTKAEAFAKWLHDGYSRRQCQSYWTSLPTQQAA